MALFVWAAARGAAAAAPSPEGAGAGAEVTSGGAPAPDARAVAAPVAGALTALVPLAVGGALWANGGSDGLQRAGTYVMVAGLAAAPWVSHGLAGRWRRALLFGGISLGTSVATLVVMNAKDPFYAPSRNQERVPFGVLLTSAFLAAAIGVVDSFVVGPVPRESP